MKKLISVFTLVAIIASFTACTTKPSTTTDSTTSKESSSTESANTNESASNSSEISVQVEKAWLPHYEKSVERVKQKYPNAKIKFIEIGSFEHMDIITSTSPSNPDVADVFTLGLDRVEDLDTNDVLASFDAKRIGTELGGYGDDYDKSLGGTLKLNDRYLAIPMNIETLVIFANEENAKKNNIDLTKPIEFTNLKYQDMLLPLFNGWYGAAFTNSVDLNLLYKKEDSSLSSDLIKNYSELTSEQQSLFTALYKYWKEHDDAKTPLWDKNASNAYLDTSITTGGPTSLRIDGPWATAGIAEKTNKGENLSILPIDQVTINGKPLHHWRAGWALGVNARIEEDKNKLAVAEEMIKQILNPEYAVDLFKASGRILPNVTEEVYMKSDLSSLDKKVISATIRSYKVATTRIFAVEWGQMFATWENSILSWSSTKPKSPEEAYKSVNSGFSSLVKSFVK